MARRHTPRPHRGARLRSAHAAAAAAAGLAGLSGNGRATFELSDSDPDSRIRRRRNACGRTSLPRHLHVLRPAPDDPRRARTAWQSARGDPPGRRRRGFVRRSVDDRTAAELSARGDVRVVGCRVEPTDRRDARRRRHANPARVRPRESAGQYRDRAHLSTSRQIQHAEPVGTAERRLRATARHGARVLGAGQRDAPRATTGDGPRRRIGCCATRVLRHRNSRTERHPARTRTGHSDVGREVSGGGRRTRRVVGPTSHRRRRRRATTSSRAARGVQGPARTVGRRRRPHPSRRSRRRGHRRHAGADRHRARGTVEVHVVSVRRRSHIDRRAAGASQPRPRCRRRASVPSGAAGRAGLPRLRIQCRVGRWDVVGSRLGRRPRRPVHRRVRPDLAAARGGRRLQRTDYQVWSPVALRGDAPRVRPVPTPVWLLLQQHSGCAHPRRVSRCHAGTGGAVRGVVRPRSRRRTAP